MLRRFGAWEKRFEQDEQPVGETAPEQDDASLLIEERVTVLA